MLDVLGVITPMFFLLGVGMLAGFAPRFQDAQAGINAFVFYFSLPAFLFVAVTAAPVREGIPGAFVWISLGATAIVFAAVYGGTALLRRVLPSRQQQLLPGPTAVASTYGNVGYLGVPIVLSVVGVEAALGAALGQLLHNMLFMVGYPVLKSLSREARRAAPDRSRGLASELAGLFWRVMKKAVILNPVVLGVVAGLVVAISGVRLPSVVDDSIAMLGQAAVPAAMFAVGLSIKPALAGMRSGSISVASVIVASGIKLAVLPLVTLGLLPVIGAGLEQIWVATAVIMAAMPVSSTASIIVFEHDGDVRLVGATTLVTSVLGVVTIPVVLSLALP